MAFWNLVDIAKFILDWLKFTQPKFFKKIYDSIQYVLEILDDMGISRVRVLSTPPIEIKPIELKLY